MAGTISPNQTICGRSWLPRSQRSPSSISRSPRCRTSLGSRVLRASKTKIRKQAALRFVQHAVTMELLDTHVIKLAGNSGQAAVRYRLNLSTDQYDVVSLVAMKREQGYWRIHSERIQTVEYRSPSYCSPSRYSCLGGTCRIQ